MSDRYGNTRDKRERGYVGHTGKICGTRGGIIWVAGWTCWKDMVIHDTKGRGDMWDTQEKYVGQVGFISLTSIRMGDLVQRVWAVTLHCPWGDVCDGHVGYNLIRWGNMFHQVLLSVIIQ